MADGPDIAIDHLILGIGDLERGIEQFERLTGVRPVFGGVHPGRGTQNALVSLGEGQYLEILAPDPRQTVDEPVLQGLRTLESLTPVGWAAAAQDLEEVQAWLTAATIQTTSIRPGSRARPDGTRLEWSTLDLPAEQSVTLPFFIRWADMSMHPSRTTPAGCTLASLRLEDPAPEHVRAVLGSLPRGVRVEARAEPGLSFILDCPTGRVTFG
ncbi:MAG TPA: VOC family protein [Longimicrobiaceae bacterium]|nr:VOC family protein [Longimicrobiaceae bacterium]